MLDLLKGIRIISFNHFLMGPLGVQILADMGADVICIESTAGGFQRRFGGAKTFIDGDGCSFHLAGRIDECGVVFFQGVIAQSKSIHDPGPKIFGDHIG